MTPTHDPQAIPAEVRGLFREIDDAIDSLPADPGHLTLAQLERLAAAMRHARVQLAELRDANEHAEAVHHVRDLIERQHRLSRWLDAGVAYWSRHDRRRWHREWSRR